MSAVDFKLGLRILRRYPGITVIGTVAMAVAISLGTLYFEGLHKGLSATLPAPDADRIVVVRYWDLGKRAVEDRSLHDFSIARASVKTFQPFGAAVAFSRNLVTTDRRVEAVRGAEVTASAFTVMGMTPLLGRTLTARDEQAAGASLGFGGAWTTVIVVQVATTVALIPLAPVPVAASNRFGQRAEAIVSGVFMRAFLQIAAGILVGSAVAALKIDFRVPTQVLYLVGADAVMLIAGLVACALPLRRALSINPTEALRAEA